MEILVGYTGFVGSNIWESHCFDKGFNSRNITEAYGLCPDLCVYSAVPAEMFLANQNPQADLENIHQAIENIEKISPKCLVLISTVAVYGDDCNEKYEDSDIDFSKAKAYGKNRLYLEEWVEKNVKNHLIIRLPAIYGENLKKNFIHDCIHPVPSLLKKNKFEELSNNEPLLKKYFEDRKDGFYKRIQIGKEEERILEEVFRKLGFTSLLFTDSRSVYQFYPLRRLWNDIELALNSGIKKLNITTEPIAVSNLYEKMESVPFVNEVMEKPYCYNIKSRHAELYGGNGGYIMNKDEVMEDVIRFIKEERER